MAKPKQFKFHIQVTDEWNLEPFEDGELAIHRPVVAKLVEECIKSVFFPVGDDVDPEIPDVDLVWGLGGERFVVLIADDYDAEFTLEDIVSEEIAALEEKGDDPADYEDVLRLADLLQKEGKRLQEAVTRAMSDMGLSK